MRVMPLKLRGELTRPALIVEEINGHRHLASNHFWVRGAFLITMRNFASLVQFCRNDAKAESFGVGWELYRPWSTYYDLYHSLELDLTSLVLLRANPGFCQLPLSPSASLVRVG